MRRWQCLLIALAVLFAGCGGRGGHHPRFFPEVRFVIEPLGGQQGTTFEVDYLKSGKARYSFQEGRVFNATEPVGFFLDNAAPPYGASFKWLAGSEADVVLIVSGRTLQISPERLGPGNTGSLEIRSGDPGELADLPDKPEVRFEVDANPGTLFQGTVGDFYTSYDVGFTVDDDERLQARAPAYIFFENPRETVSATVRNANGLEITINLYVNGNLTESDTASKDAIVKHDL